MRQAIEEKFILDVLKNYTTYETYFRVTQSAEDDPHVERKKAARALARFPDPASAQSGAKNRSDGRALPHPRKTQDRWTRQGHGGHGFALACGALQTGI
ncbi:MAG: hypothetical protein R3E95_12905 [Thiolinea sp.]